MHYSSLCKNVFGNPTDDRELYTWINYGRCAENTIFCWDFCVHHSNVKMQLWEFVEATANVVRQHVRCEISAAVVSVLTNTDINRSPCKNVMKTMAERAWRRKVMIYNRSGSRMLCQRWCNEPTRMFTTQGQMGFAGVSTFLCICFSCVRLHLWVFFHQQRDLGRESNWFGESSNQFSDSWDRGD